MNWLRLPKKVYFKRGSMAVALKELHDVYEAKKAFIITGAELYKGGIARPVEDLIRPHGIRTAEYYIPEGIPKYSDIEASVQKINEFSPDVIIGIGGFDVLSYTRVAWLLYSLDLNSVVELLKADKFEKAGENELHIPESSPMMVMIPGIDAVGSDCMPYARIQDENNKIKILSSYELIPHMTVIDAEFSNHLTRDEIIENASQIELIAKAAEKSKDANDYTRGFARTARESIVKNINELEKSEVPDPVAVENILNAGSIAGISYANTHATFDE